VLSIFDFADGRYVDQTANYSDFFQAVLQENLKTWSKEKERSIQLLQTVAVNYAALGQRDDGKRFFAMSLPELLPALKKKGVDPNACIEDIESLLDRTASVRAGSSAPPAISAPQPAR
jgi:hypothetical protein